MPMPTLVGRSPGALAQTAETLTWPAATKNMSANFLLYTFVVNICYTNCLGHGHGYELSQPTDS